MNTQLHKRRLGKTDLDVTEIGSSSECTFFGRPNDDETAAKTVIYALENGINLIDTSPLYAESQRRIGIALRDYGKRQSFILSCKAGTHPEIKGYTADAFRKSVEDSLKTLHTDYLDILHIHDPEEIDFETAMTPEGALEEMIKMKEERIIRYFGLGVRSHELHRRFIESGYADVILTWLDYNLLRQNASELLTLCRRMDVGVMIGAPLCQGYLSGKDPRLIPKTHHHDMSKEVDLKKLYEMYDWCKDKNVNLQEFNNHFILQNPNADTIIIGAASPLEVKENIDSITKPFNWGLYEEFLDTFNIKK
jgi:aryl-alcohol dehydrogenase-like predicted oxidoreductase